MKVGDELVGMAAGLGVRLHLRSIGETGVEVEDAERRVRVRDVRSGRFDRRQPSAGDLGHVFQGAFHAGGNFKPNGHDQTLTAADFLRQKPTEGT